MFDDFLMKTLSTKLLQVLRFLVTLRPENVLLDVDGHVRRGFCRVFSRCVMWFCEQRPLSHLRLTDFGLAKMGLRLDLDFKSHQTHDHIKHINCEAKISHPPCVALLSIYHQRSIASDPMMFPRKKCLKTGVFFFTSFWGFQTAVLCLWIGLAWSSESPLCYITKAKKNINLKLKTDWLTDTIFDNIFH